mmetsp:Transcript_107463/g.310612  ORF Transcript_107463/g.310612 Transcript_107463/m.310612 type:complete len:300 (+) Transcript_107463:418-1317(+)
MRRRSRATHRQLVGWRAPLGRCLRNPTRHRQLWVATVQRAWLRILPRPWQLRGLRDSCRSRRHAPTRSLHGSGATSLPERVSRSSWTDLPVCRILDLAPHAEHWRRRLVSPAELAVANHLVVMRRGGRAANGQLVGWGTPLRRRLRHPTRHRQLWVATVQRAWLRILPRPWQLRGLRDSCRSRRHAPTRSLHGSGATSLPERVRGSSRTHFLVRRVLPFRPHREARRLVDRRFVCVDHIQRPLPRRRTLAALHARSRWGGGRCRPLRGRRDRRRTRRTRCCRRRRLCKRRRRCKRCFRR